MDHSNPTQRHITLVGALVLFFTFAAAQTTTAAQPPRREQFAHADVLYDWVSNRRGDKLRTFITRPRNASGKVPVIFFVGWLSCDTRGERAGAGNPRHRRQHHEPRR